MKNNKTLPNGNAHIDFEGSKLYQQSRSAKAEREASRKTAAQEIVDKYGYWGGKRFLGKNENRLSQETLSIFIKLFIQLIPSSMVNCSSSSIKTFIVFFFLVISAYVRIKSWSDASGTILLLILKSFFILTLLKSFPSLDNSNIFFVKVLIAL